MKIIKRLISIAAILLCIIGINFYSSTISVFAADDCELILSSAQGNKGDEVTVKVTLQSNPGLAGLQYNIKYDTSALSLVSANAIEDTFKEPIINTQNEGLVVYVFAEANSNTRTGDLIEVKFKILDDANNDNLSLKLTDVMGVDNDIKEVNVKTTEGNIQLTGTSNAENNSSVENNMTSGGDTTSDNTNNTDSANGTSSDNSDNSVHTDSSGNTIETDKQGNVISNDKNNLENNSESISENKSNKGIVIIVIIIIIIVVAILGYVIYDKKFKKNNDGDNNNDNNN